MTPPRTTSLLALALGLFACNGGETDSDTVLETDADTDENGDTSVPFDTNVETDGSSPSIAVSVPTESEGPVLITGQASDPDQPSDTLLVQLTSSIDGPLMQLYPQSNSTWTWQGTLQTGTHQITAQVEDSDGNRATATATIRIAPVNHAPLCGILSPRSGATFEQGQAVTFEGWATDEDNDPVRLLWTSSESGALFQGTQYSRILPNGDHVITVNGDDYRGGTCIAAVSIHVGP